MEYLKKFETQEEYDIYSKSVKADLPYKVSLVNSKVVYDSDFEPFYIEAIDDIMIDANTTKVYKYSFDTITWNFTSDVLNVSAGEKIYLQPRTINDWDPIQINGKYNVGGKISMVSGKGNWYMSGLFQDQEGLISAEKLILTYTGGNLFKNCTNLIKAPRILSKRNGSSWGLQNMFEGCTSLTESPVLRLGKYYENSHIIITMDNMFKGCSNLNKITEFLTGGLPTGYMSQWVDGVAEQGLYVTNTWRESSLPTGWEVKMYDENEDRYYVQIKIDTIIYDSEDDMTWKNWLNSKYNTKKFTSNETNILKGDKILMLGDTPVAPTDIVKRIVGTDYTFITPEIEEPVEPAEPAE